MIASKKAFDAYKQQTFTAICPHHSFSSLHVFSAPPQETVDWKCSAFKFTLKDIRHLFIKSKNSHTYTKLKEVIICLSFIQSCKFGEQKRWVKKKSEFFRSLQNLFAKVGGFLNCFSENWSLQIWNRKNCFLDTYINVYVIIPASNIEAYQISKTLGVVRRNARKGIPYCRSISDSKRSVRLRIPYSEDERFCSVFWTSITWTIFCCLRLP